MADIASFSAYPSYLAARLDGLKKACGLSQFEAYGKYVKFVEDEGDGDESELEFELIQPHMAQKPVLRGEVDARALRM